MQQPHQSAGHAHHGDGGLGGLGHVQQVVEQSLVLVVGEQVELVQDEQDRTAAAAIAWPETRKPPKVNRRGREKVNAHRPREYEKKVPTGVSEEGFRRSCRTLLNRSLGNTRQINLRTFFQGLQQESQIFCKTSLKRKSDSDSSSTPLNRCEAVPTHENFVADDVLQLQLPRYFFQRYAVVRLQEPCRQETQPEMQELSE